MADDKTVAVYAEQVAKYEAMGISPTQMESIDAFLGKLKPGGRILDLGCGPGLHAAIMKAKGFAVEATDATPSFVQKARDRGIDARVATFADLDLDAHYDAVWASFSLLHAPKVAFPDHLAAIARSLRPKGWLYLGMKLGEGEARDQIGRFYAYYSQEDLTQHLDAAGFTIDSVVTGQDAGLSGEIARFALIHARLRDA